MDAKFLDRARAAGATGPYVKLVKLKTLPDGKLGENPPRTDEIEGIAMAGPIVGMPFTVISESLTRPGEFRSWRTSPVREVSGSDNECFIRTQNSLYQLVIWS